MTPKAQAEKKTALTTKTFSLEKRINKMKDQLNNEEI